MLFNKTLSRNQTAKGVKNMERRELVKTCKNGTKVWKYTGTCVKCGGSGYVPFNYADGICFDCNGTGLVTWKENEYTPEHEAELRSKREKEAKARAEQMQARILAQIIDEAHKEALIENKKRDRYKAEAAVSTWQGTVKKRLTVKATLTVSFYWESKFGIQYLHMMKDADGNVYKWTTGDALGYYEQTTGKDYAYEDENGIRWNWHGIEENNAEAFIITGTVKEHATYRDVKQTVLTRCKVTKAD